MNNLIKGALGVVYVAAVGHLTKKALVGIVAEEKLKRADILLSLDKLLIDVQEHRIKQLEKQLEELKNEQKANEEEV